jgi:hypothetical protein
MNDKRSSTPFLLDASQATTPTASFQQWRSRLSPFHVVEAALRASDAARQGAAAFDAEASQFPSTRAAVIGSEDNQRHALSHTFKIFNGLDLPPLEVVGMDAIGPIGAAWMLEAAIAGGPAPGPELRRRVLQDPSKALACRLAGAIACWRHLRLVQEETLVRIEALIAAGNTYWRQKNATYAQLRLLNWIEELVRVEDPTFHLPPIKLRGEAYDAILAAGGNPQLRDQRDAAIVSRLHVLLQVIELEANGRAKPDQHLRKDDK